MPSSRSHLALTALVPLFGDSVLCQLHVVELSGSWHLSKSHRIVVLQSQVPGYALHSLDESGIVQNPLSG